MKIPRKFEIKFLTHIKKSLENELRTKWPALTNRGFFGRGLKRARGARPVGIKDNTFAGPIIGKMYGFSFTRVA